MLNCPEMSRYTVFYRSLLDPDPTEEAALELAFAELQVVVVDAFESHYLVEGDVENITDALKGYPDWKFAREQVLRPVNRYL
jgi:hypothetical protein